MPLGTLLGLLITGLVSVGLDETDPVDCFNRIEVVTSIQNVIITIFAVLTLMLFREKPTYPPSKFALVKRDITKAGLSDDVKMLRQNTDYMGNAWIFVVIWGSYVSIGNLLTPLFGSFYTTSQISLIGGGFVAFGIISTALVGFIIDKTKAYLVVIKVIVWVVSFIFLLAIWVIPAGNIYLTVLLASLLGAFITPILPAGYSFSVHLTHPLPPAVSNGLMMTAS